MATFDSSTILKAVFPSREKRNLNLLLINGSTSCFHRINVSTISALDRCAEQVDSQMGTILAVATTNEFKQYVFDSAFKIWLLEEDENLELKVTPVHNRSTESVVPSFMTIGTGNEYLYISSTDGVWQLNLKSSEEKLIVKAGNLSNDGSIEEASVKTPGSFSFLNEDVFLIVDVGTQSLRVVNLLNGTVSSICQPHDSDQFVAGKISECQLLKPKFILYDPALKNGSIYIGGAELHSLTYITKREQRKSSLYCRTPPFTDIVKCFIKRCFGTKLLVFICILFDRPNYNAIEQLMLSVTKVDPVCNE